METTIIENLNLPAIPEKKKLAILAEFEFEKYEAIASEWAEKANALEITDASQLQEMKLADDGRKVLQKIRTGIDKKRKELKEASLNEGRAIDAIAKKLTELVEPIERVLEEKAKYAENLEKERIQKLHDERYNEIIPYLEEIPVGFNYGSLDNGTWQAMLKYAKEEHQERLDLAEAQRIAQEAEDKKKEIYNERRVLLAPFERFVFTDLTIDTTEDEFLEWLQQGRHAQLMHEQEQDKIREENERLLAEQQKAKQIRESRSKELAPYIVFIRDYNALIESDEESYSIQFKEIKKGAEDHWEFEKQEYLKIQQQKEKQQAELERLHLQHTREKALFNVDFNSGEMDLASMSQDEFKSLYETHQKIYLDKITAEKQKQEDQKKLASAPDIEKMKKLADDLDAFVVPEFSTDEFIKLGVEVQVLIAKIVSHIDLRVQKIK